MTFRTLPFVLLLVMMASCRQTPQTDMEAAKQELLERDQSWSKTVSEVGFMQAMGEYYADDLISISPGKKPVMGKATLEKYMNEFPDTSTAFHWKPKKADVSQSGDLGYTFGYWEYQGMSRSGADTTFYGAYTTIWKKQADGKWRAVVDQSNNTPKP